MKLLDTRSSALVFLLLALQGNLLTNSLKRYGLEIKNHDKLVNCAVFHATTHYEKCNLP